MENKLRCANAPRSLEVLLISAPGYPLGHRAAFVSFLLGEKELLQRLINLYGKEVLFVRISIDLYAKNTKKSIGPQVLCNTDSLRE